MTSNQFVKLSHAEIRDVYNRAQQFVKTHMRNSDSLNMSLAPFEERFIGQTHLSLPIFGTNSLKQTRQLHEMLENTFGTDVDGNPPYIYDEIQADGTGTIYKLNIPILFRKSKKAQGYFSHASEKMSSPPTLEWPLFLMLVEIGLCGVMYYRYATGVAF